MLNIVIQATGKNSQISVKSCLGDYGGKNVFPNYRIELITKQYFFMYKKGTHDIER